MSPHHRALLPLLLCGLTAFGQHSPTNPTEDCFIVTLTPEVSTVRQNEMFHSLNGTTGVVWGRALHGFVKCGLAPADVAALRQDPRVQAVETDAPTRATGVQSGPSVPWHLDRIDQRDLPLNQVFEYPNTGAGVTIFMMDTGIRSTHVEFTGRVAPGFSTVSNNTEDCNGHGTHTAGLAAGITYGVAKAALLVPIQILNCDGSGVVSDIITGLDWIMAYGPLPGVINLSLTSVYVGAVNTAVANAVAAGFTVTAAAGNDGANACNYSPASEPTAITVGASDPTDAVPAFSNNGTCVDAQLLISCRHDPGKTKKHATRSLAGIQGGAQTALETAVGVSMNYPTLIAISASKLRYAAHRGAFSLEPISAFLGDVWAGRQRTIELKALPTLVPVAPWDGKDYAPPVEEEDSASE